MTKDRYDSKGLIRESFRIDGISASECRSIFLDWALSLPNDLSDREALPVVIDRYADQPEDHPMRQILRDGLNRMTAPKRRGGWRGRRSEDPS